MEKYLLEIKKVISTHSVLAGEMAMSLKPLIDDFPSVYNYFQKNTTAEKITDVIVGEICEFYVLFGRLRTVIFDLLCDSYSSYVDLISIPMDHPCTVAMLMTIY